LLELEHQSEVEDLETRALDDVGVPDEDDLGDELIVDALNADELEQELDRHI
jgi:hypothetical protein